MKSIAGNDYNPTLMYHFSYFKEKDQNTLLEFMEAYPFAFLTGSFPDGMQVATQVPVTVEMRDGELYVQGHIMRKTDHHKAFEENPNALLVFTGPSAYVSASWYSQPQMGSTWNYMSVHVAGKMRFMSDAELVAWMKKFTLRFEQGNTQSPTIFENLPESYTGKMLPAIVGFEIKAEKLDNVFKLSQNRDEKSYLNIIARLEQQGGIPAMVAEEMKKRHRELFPEGVEWDGERFES